MGAIIPFRKQEPQSFRKLIQEQSPRHVKHIISQGGPREEDYEAARALKDILGFRGDELQFIFEPGTKKQEEVARKLISIARHIATLAFFPGGIRVFGLRIQVVDGELSVEQVGGLAGEFLPLSARKNTGSYYTPRSLIECLLDSALEPVMEDVIARSSYPRIQANARRGILINLARRIQTKEE